MIEKAIAIVELISVARGILVADAMLKSADVTLYIAGTTCPGKYLVVAGGHVGAVKSALASAEAVGKEAITDSLLIPNVHKDIFPALCSGNDIDKVGALGVVETMSAPATIEAADAAAKASSVKIIEIRMGKGMGAKSFFTFTGDVSEVRTAARAAEAKVADKGLLVDIAVVANPHKELPKFVV